VPDRLEGRLRWLFGGVAVVLVAGGVHALLVTAQPEPAQAGVDVATTLLRATAVLAVATIAALAVLVVRAPRRRTHLMPVLAIGAGMAALVLLLGTLRAAGVEAEPVAPLAGATLVAVLLAVASALGWLRLWLAPRPGVATATRDAALLNALLATLVPEGEGIALAGNDPEIRARIERAFAARGSARRPVLRIVLRVLDVRAWRRHRRSFSRLDQDAREALVGDLAIARSARLRAIATLLDEIVLSVFYGDPRVRGVLADDVHWISARLDVGPNADAHRVRRDELARATLAAEAAASAQDAAEDAVLAVEADDAAAVATEEASSPAAVATEDVEAETSSTTISAGVTPSTRETPAAEEVPFDRAWTLGVPQEPSAPVAGTPLLRVARSSGPTRP